MPEEREENNQEDDDGVVHREVDEVVAEAEVRLAEGRREAEGGGIDELSPGPARGERGGAPLLGAVDVVERRGGRRRRCGGARRNRAIGCHGEEGERNELEIGITFGIVSENKRETPQFESVREQGGKEFQGGRID